MKIKDYINNHDLVSRVMPVLQKVLDIAQINEILHCPIYPCSGTSKGGYWKPQSKEMYLNGALPIEYQKNTFLHELAHAMVTFKYRDNNPFVKIRSHGIQWRIMMMQLGLHPDRC